MSTILTARHHQGKPQAAVMEGREGGETRQKEYITSDPSRGVFVTDQDKSSKQIVSQNFGKPLNNRTHTENDTKTNQYSQSSIQVRFQNEEHAHY